jgi:hypothetical protein
MIGLGVWSPSGLNWHISCTYIIPPSLAFLSFFLHKMLQLWTPDSLTDGRTDGPTHHVKSTFQIRFFFISQGWSLDWWRTQPHCLKTTHIPSIIQDFFCQNYFQFCGFASLDFFISKFKQIFWIYTKGKIPELKNWEDSALCPPH